MQADAFDAAYRASRRHYELGRLAVAARHAAIGTMIVAALAGIALGRSALVWLPFTFTAIVVSEWRGTFLMKGARRGLLVGAASLLLPLSLLRPCCGSNAKLIGASCCTMPSACWLAGGLVGLGMAALVPRTRSGQLEAAFGMLLGVTAITLLRCSMLFLGETLGLVGGLAAGVAATTVVRLCLVRRAA